MSATPPSGEASTAACSRAEGDAWVAGTRRNPAARYDAHTGKDAV
ncbi:hypothetical protein [Nocardia abscessus]|nr:hypothetical protein [Nocardia abscessus]